MVKYNEVRCESALNKLKRKLPYSWDLNIYKGCEHGCIYCYAMYVHQYLNAKDYANEIFIKTNIIEKLEQELAAPSWKREIVNLGGVTDSYQIIEEKYQLTREALKLLIKYKTPVIISTKSTLVLRDLDLINELSKITYVNIAFTITSFDEEVRKKIEPNAASTLERFKALKEIKEKTNASVGIHLMPIIPYITDSAENLDYIFKMAKECHIDYLLPGTLYLIGKTRTVFMQTVKEKFPDIYPKINELYQTGKASIDYKNQLYQLINSLREKYNVPSSYKKVMDEKFERAKEFEQLTLF